MPSQWYQSPTAQFGPCGEGMSRCVDCGECKSDPDDFYDGLRCIMCCEEEEEEEDGG